MNTLKDEIILNWSARLHCPLTVRAKVGVDGGPEIVGLEAGSPPDPNPMFMADVMDEEELAELDEALRAKAAKLVGDE